MTSVGKRKSRGERQEICKPPEKGQQIIDDLRLL